MDAEPKLKGRLIEQQLPRLKGSLAEKALVSTVDRDANSGILRGKGLEIVRDAEELPRQVYKSLKNGKRYEVIEFRDRSDKGLGPIVCLQCLDDISTVNLAASALEDSERFAPDE